MNYCSSKNLYKSVKIRKDTRLKLKKLAVYLEQDMQELASGILEKHFEKTNIPDIRTEKNAH